MNPAKLNSVCKDLHVVFDFLITRLRIISDVVRRKEYIYLAGTQKNELATDDHQHGCNSKVVYRITELCKKTYIRRKNERDMDDSRF
jgi:hypothetical protein